jgi:hypothetical protein
MLLEYASRGLVGMLTPQANTTVEPEFNLLWPPRVAMINARLMSDEPAMEARLIDYFANYGGALGQFANAPLKAAAAACTGASYLAGREREASVVAELEARHGFAFITAARPIRPGSTRRALPIGAARASSRPRSPACSTPKARFIRFIASKDRPRRRRCVRSKANRSTRSSC